VLARLPLFWRLQLGGWLAFGAAMTLSRLGTYPLGFFMLLLKGLLTVPGPDRHHLELLDSSKRHLRSLFPSNEHPVHAWKRPGRGRLPVTVPQHLPRS